MRAMNAAGRDLFGEHFTFEGVLVAGGLDPVLFAEAATNHGLDDQPQHHDRFHRRYVKQLTTDFDTQAAQAVPKPGIIELLEVLGRRDDVTLGIVSGNYRVAADIKLTAAGIDPAQFLVTGYGDDGPDRPSIVAHAMHEYEQLRGMTIFPGDVIVIGDTPRDVHCARANGCVAFAVATGPYTLDELREAGADAAVESMSDSSPLLTMLTPSRT